MRGRHRVDLNHAGRSRTAVVFLVKLRMGKKEGKGKERELNVLGDELTYARLDVQI